MAALLFIYLGHLILAINFLGAFGYAGPVPPNAQSDVQPIPPGYFGMDLDMLPGCAENLDLHAPPLDCFIATKAFLAPNYCIGNPDTGNCVRYLALPFCVDAADPDDNEALARCIEGVPYGPCHINPGGRACSSKLFSHFAFVQPDTSSHAENYQNQTRPTSENSKRQAAVNPYAFYGGPKDSEYLRAHNQWQIDFFTGLLKGFWNTIVTLPSTTVNTIGLVGYMQCKEMEDENFAVQLDPSALSELNKYCEQNYHEIQNMAGAVEVLEEPIEFKLINPAQEAGSIASLVITLLLPLFGELETGVVAGEAISASQTVTEMTNFVETAEDGSGILRAEAAATGDRVEIRLADEAGNNVRAMSRDEAEFVQEYIKNNGLDSYNEMIVCNPGTIPKRIKVLNICAITGMPVFSAEEDAILNAQSAEQQIFRAADDASTLHGQAPAAILPDSGIPELADPRSNLLGLDPNLGAPLSQDNAMIQRWAGFVQGAEADGEAQLIGQPQRVNNPEDLFLVDPGVRGGPVRDPTWESGPSRPQGRPLDEGSAPASEGADDQANQAAKRLRVTLSYLERYPTLGTEFMWDSWVPFPGTGPEEMGVLDLEKSLGPSLERNSPAWYLEQEVTAGKSREDMAAEFLRINKDPPIPLQVKQRAGRPFNRLQSIPDPLETWSETCLPIYKGIISARVQPATEEILAAFENTLTKPGAQPRSYTLDELKLAKIRGSERLRWNLYRSGFGGLFYRSPKPVLVIRSKTARLIGPLLDKNYPPDTIVYNVRQSDMISFRLLGKARYNMNEAKGEAFIYFKHHSGKKEWPWAYFLEEV